MDIRSRFIPGTIIIFYDHFYIIIIFPVARINFDKDGEFERENSRISLGRRVGGGGEQETHRIQILFS